MTSNGDSKTYSTRVKEGITVVLWVYLYLFGAISLLLIFCCIVYHFVTSARQTFSAEAPSLHTVLRDATSLEGVVTLITYPTLKFTALLLFLASYIVHWYNDLDAPERGSHPRHFIRNLTVWRHLAEYFPVRLRLSDELLSHASSALETNADTASTTEIPRPLSPQYNYLVGFHPHGIFTVGAFINFATEATGFSKVFPSITPWLTTLPLQFKIPFHRDYIMSYSVVSASKRSLQYLLDSRFSGKTGNFVVVVLGGAPESLDARPGRYVMHTSYRFGFFKIALQTGAHLIPCVSFGEQSMYKQVSNEPGGKLRRFQEWFCDWSTFAPPLFYARGPFPYRTPVDTVVGAPIPCERVAQPTREQIAALKKVYVDRLQALFHRYKAEYDPDAADVEFV